jgi:hypothetical protein
MAKTFLDLQNVRASKIEATIAKILDVDLARFYNEVVSDMSKFGQKLKKVTTNIVAAQTEYGEAVLPGFVSSALVKVGGVIAPYIGIEDYAFESDRASIRHTVINNAVSILPIPSTAVANGLEVWYWAKIAEIVDGAVPGTVLTDLDDKHWNVVVLGVTLKMYEKLFILSAVNSETIPDGSVEALAKVVKHFEKKYSEALDGYGNSMQLMHKPATSKGPSTRENEQPSGIGRQSGGF